jgi:hypothetical protein
MSFLSSLFGKSKEQKQKDALWEAYKPLFEKSEQDTKINNDLFSPPDLENKVKNLLRYLYEIKNGYSIYELKNNVGEAYKSFDYIQDVQHRKEFKESFEEGVKTFFIINGNDSLESDIVEIVRSFDLDRFRFFINQEALNIMSRIEAKNYELISKYKRKDHIRGRYETINESVKEIQGLIEMADNYTSVREKLSQIKNRAFDRGQLHITN